MTPRSSMPLAAALMAGLIGAGCANNANNLSTAGIAPDKTAAETSKADPACIALANQITTLRSESAVANLEKAATGKGKSVQVQRAALGKQAELNKANADFQMKCGPKIPAQAAATPSAPATTAATAQTATTAAKAAPVAAAAADTAAKTAVDTAKTGAKAAVAQ